MIDLPRIVDKFALVFDELPRAVPGVHSIRMLIGVGALVAAFVVHGVEMTDGIVELVGVELDRSPDPSYGVADSINSLWASCAGRPGV